MTETDLRRRQESTIPPDAFLMIIGAMKAGTTTLYDYLAMHPNICSAPVKEVEFFASQQNHGYRINGQKPDAYAPIWDFDPKRHHYALEASTGYTKYPREQRVPERIKDYGIRPTFLYLVRDPIQRLQSHANHASWKLEEPLELTETHVGYGNYFLQLEQYRKHFPKESLIILDFDDLTANPGQLLADLFKRLNLPGMRLPEGALSANQTKTYSKVEVALGKVGVKPKLEWLPQPVRTFLKNAVRKPLPSHRRALTPEERDWAYNLLKPDMLRFRDEYGFDVAKWGFR